LLNGTAAQDDECCRVEGECSTAPRTSDVADPEVCRNNLNLKPVVHTAVLTGYVSSRYVNCVNLLDTPQKLLNYNIVTIILHSNMCQDTGIALRVCV
jgi:hypothetical protein